MAINVSKTTASVIIEKFVQKINRKYIASIDHKKLIIDYKAVRRAVRNEGSVTFGRVGV